MGRNKPFLFYLPFDYGRVYVPGVFISSDLGIIMAARYALSHRWHLSAEYRYSIHSVEPFSGLADVMVENGIALGAGYQAGAFSVHGYLDYSPTYDDFTWGLGCGWTFNDYARVQLFYDGGAWGGYDVEALLVLTI